MALDYKKILTLVGVCLVVLIVLSWANAFAVYNPYDLSYSGDETSEQTTDTGSVSSGVGVNSPSLGVPVTLPGVSAPSCLDSDGGLHYGIPGYANDGTTLVEDSCEGDILIEAICTSDGKAEGRRKLCHGSCLIAAALGYAYCSEELVCTDTDGGLHPPLKGETKGLSLAGDLVAHVDYCYSPSQIVEGYCNSLNFAIVVNATPCISGTFCSAGACIPVPSAPSSGGGFTWWNPRTWF